MNTYAYVSNNPVMFVDPLGLEPGMAAIATGIGDAIGRQTGLNTKQQVQTLKDFGNKMVCKLECVADAAVGITPETFTQNAVKECVVDRYETILGGMGYTSGKILSKTISPSVTLYDMYSAASCSIKCK